MNMESGRLVSQFSGLLGALIGGGASLAVAVYTHRSQDRLQRVAHEITKRETIYAEFLMEASKLLLRAYTRDEVVAGNDEQQLIGLINRMRLFAPTDVVGGAEAVVKAIIEISLKPGIEFRQLAVQALSKSPEPDPFLMFSLVCRSDLDNVRRTMR
jgi:HAMP domain-containing protein